MATKLEEKKAFKKLRDTFPKEYCTLDLENIQYSSGEVVIQYKAYAGLDGNRSHLSDKYNNPIDAVNEVIKHFGREK